MKAYLIRHLGAGLRIAVQERGKVNDRNLGKAEALGN